MDHKLLSLRELKFARDSNAEMAFEGYGAAFGNEDSYGDIIVPGAFAEYIDGVKRGAHPWPAMMSQHGALGLTSEDLTPIGVWTDMAEDDAGLRVKGVLADTARGIEIYKLMKMSPRPAIDGLSIGYKAEKWDMQTKSDGGQVRMLKQLRLNEISPVTFPANTAARVGSVKASDMTERELERLLTQDAGLSRSEARALLRHGLAGLKRMQDAAPKPNGEEQTDALRELLAAVERNTQFLQAARSGA